MYDGAARARRKMVYTGSNGIDAHDPLPHLPPPRSNTPPPGACHNRSNDPLPHEVLYALKHARLLTRYGPLA